MSGEASGPVPLGRGFFARPAPTVAADLVGKLLVGPGDGLVARVVETEAYRHDDPACHGYRGRTARNAPLFGPPGHAYVYFSYGMHWCLNVATGVEGIAEGCLLRAAEPLEGLARMRARRGAAADRDLLRGPGRLGQAYGLGRADSGSDMCGRGPLCFADDGACPAVASGPRVGVAHGADTPWRFYVPDSRWVSAYKRNPARPRRLGPFHPALVLIRLREKHIRTNAGGPAGRIGAQADDRVAGHLCAGRRPLPPHPCGLLGRAVGAAVRGRRRGPGARTRPAPGVRPPRRRRRRARRARPP